MRRVVRGAPSAFYRRVREILESARAGVARTVNTTQVMANWLIGREIVEEEQKGKTRAGYGEALLKDLSARLSTDVGKGWSVRNLEYCRVLYRAYPLLLGNRKSNAVRSISSTALPAKAGAIANAARAESWQPGRLHPNLSWTHYRTLLRVDKTDARAFYEIESIKNAWSARELERQINSLLYERLLMSQDKESVLAVAKGERHPTQPQEIIKDPTVLEFLDLKPQAAYYESDLEQAIITHLQDFLLELGNGFSFVARQKRIILGGDEFKIDLVFYNRLLQCFVLFDIKIDKITHQDLGQLQMYVNYYDRDVRADFETPTIGVLLCADKNNVVVRYSLPEDNRQIVASKYLLHLPTEAQLREEVQKELERFSTDEPK